MSRGARQDAASADAGSTRMGSSAWRPAGWAIWSIPRRLLGPVLVVELTAVALTALSANPSQFDRASLTLGAMVGAIGIVHSEIALRVERIRRRVTETLHVDLSSVWTFAGAVLLPPTLAAGVATLVFTHLWWRSWRPRVPVYRHVFSTATVVLSCLAAGAVAGVDRDGGIAVRGDVTGVLLLAVAILAYTTVNSALVAGAVAVSSPQPDIGKVLGRWDDNLLEFATLSLGAITAVALSINPMLVVLVLPPLLVLHRAVLVKHLEEAANTDGKTGLLNAAAWHVQAQRVLQRRRRGDGGTRGVLVLDLDHFKAVNDTHGHIAGDHVLAAVADVLRAEVREHDLIGRFGGEEFVVMLAGVDGPAELESVAERIRRRVAELRVEMPTPDGPLTVMGLSVSVGCALAVDVGADLRDLLVMADRALYAAKGAGRNAVRMGSAPLGRPPLRSLNKGAGTPGAQPNAGD